MNRPVLLLALLRAVAHRLADSAFLGWTLKADEADGRGVDGDGRRSEAKTAVNINAQGENRLESLRIAQIITAIHLVRSAILDWAFKA